MEFNKDFAYLPLVKGEKFPANKNGVKGAAKPGTPGFTRLLQEYPVDRHDWGIACGQISGIVVLDIDKKSNGLDTLKEFNHNHSMDLVNITCAIGTPSGGYHLYFQLKPGQTFKNKVGFLPGWDLRAESGYVKFYNNFVNDYPLEEVPSVLLSTIEESDQKRSLNAVDAMPGGREIGEGGRNHYMTKVAGQLQRNDLLTLEALQAVNERDCNPPLDDRELEVIFNSISRYVPERPISLQMDYVATNKNMSQSVSLAKSYQHITGGGANQGNVYQREAAAEGQVIKASDLSLQMVEFLADKEKVKGEPTLLTGLDDLLGGGHRLGEVTCYHAEAKTGKNTLWHKMMHLWLTRKQGAIPMAYASRELTPETEVLPDLLSIHLQKNVRLLDVPKAQYIDIIKDWPLFFAAGYGHFPFDEIVKWVLSCKALGVQYFWFDHLHYMLEDPEDHKVASRLIKDIKSLAKTENINVQIIIQPNKLMDGQKLSLNSIKGGAAMGQAIDNLIILERLRCGTPNIMMLKTHAVRSKLAKAGTIYLQYNPQTIDMIEVEPEELDTEANRGPTFGTNEE